MLKHDKEDHQIMQLAHLRNQVATVDDPTEKKAKAIKKATKKTELTEDSNAAHDQNISQQ